MTFREVILCIDGLINKNKMHEAWIRRATFIIAATGFGGKGVANKMRTLWPIEEVDKGQVSDKALEQLAKFREQEALLRVDKKMKDKANG